MLTMLPSELPPTELIRNLYHLKPERVADYQANRRSSTAKPIFATIHSDPELA
jgi:hypothetical protein